MLSVFVYHLGATGGGEHFLPGGFIGVDVFFVLSGYLITSLLLVELGQTGRISIKQFYLRRARRLLPALFALLLIVATIGSIWLPQQAARLRGDLFASFAYVTNWWLIAQEASYFGTGERPALLTHLWSLAVEEQFYLLWPLLLVLIAARRAGRVALLVLLVLAIVASTVAAAVLFDPWGDPTRVYYGTDTRAATPLIGALLAVWLRPWRQRKSSRAIWLDLLGLASIAGLAVIAVRLGDRDPMLYQGGFLVIALLAGAVVVVAGHPATRLGDLLGTQPLRWLGERSYAIYLWHWPVCVLTRPGIDVPLTGWANSALRTGLTLALAELSFWLVERPIRQSNLFRWHPLRPTPAALTASEARRVPRITARRVRQRLVTVGLTVVLVIASAGVVARLNLAAGQAVFVMGEGPIDPAPDVNLEVVMVGPGPGAPRQIPIKVAIFGDSQGKALFANRPADIGKFLKLSDESISACGILRGKVRSRSGEGFDLVKSCPRWQSEWQRDANRVKPGIALVVIGAWDVFDLTTAEGKLVFATPQWDAAFNTVLAEGIAALRSSGATVALALLPCYRPIQITGGAGYWPERGDDNRTAHVNSLLRAAVTEHVHTVEPAAGFCTDPAVAANRKYRWDGIILGVFPVEGSSGEVVEILEGDQSVGSRHRRGCRSRWVSRLCVAPQRSRFRIG